jgi:hypothetical protein
VEFNRKSTANTANRREPQRQNRKIGDRKIRQWIANDEANTFIRCRVGPTLDSLQLLTIHVPVPIPLQ